MPAPTYFSLAEAAEYYGVPAWGAPYFRLDRAGTLLVSPEGRPDRSASLPTIVEQGSKLPSIRFPFLLRFPQIIAHRLRSLHKSFQRSLEDFEYGASVQGVFPIKVNQRRYVIEHLLEAGRDIHYGLEVGSKAELAMALSFELPEKAVVICNGYKDRHYASAACLARQMGTRVLVIIEKLGELPLILDMASRHNVQFELGLRLKLSTRGSGHWVESGGEWAKFGLTTVELLEAVRALRAAGRLDWLTTLHFHIGSQVTSVRRVKDAVREAARIYTKLKPQCQALSTLDVGGGLGVDYVGNRSESMSSVNYSLQEYTNTIVYGIADVCEEEDIDPPHLIFESGRAVTAHHAVLCVQALTEHTSLPARALHAPREDDHKILHDLYETWEQLSAANFREYYHDALEYRELLSHAWGFGDLSLEEKGLGDTIFREICRKALEFSKLSAHQEEQFERLERNLAEKYLFNFSIFQSLPDTWAFDQLFPIVPLTRLYERPTVPATLCDITCDSDGIVEQFIGEQGQRDSLFLHSLNGDEPYVLALFLVGAYQDVLGDYHNLFGAVSEIEVRVTGPGVIETKPLHGGDVIESVIKHFASPLVDVRAAFEERLARGVREGRLSEDNATRLRREFGRCISGSTYLELEKQWQSEESPAPAQDFGAVPIQSPPQKPNGSHEEIPPASRVDPVRR